eukprot:XP_022276533.1 uncharacterized protein LOC111096592 isoform X2 [Canis lupus familiaris]
MVSFRQNDLGHNRELWNSWSSGLHAGSKGDEKLLTGGRRLRVLQEESRLQPSRPPGPFIQARTPALSSARPPTEAALNMSERTLLSGGQSGEPEEGNLRHPPC